MTSFGGFDPNSPEFRRLHEAIQRAQRHIFNDPSIMRAIEKLDTSRILSSIDFPAVEQAANIDLTAFKVPDAFDSARFEMPHEVISKLETADFSNHLRREFDNIARHSQVVDQLSSVALEAVDLNESTLDIETIVKTATPLLTDDLRASVDSIFELAADLPRADDVAKEPTAFEPLPTLADIFNRDSLLAVLFSFGCAVYFSLAIASGDPASLAANLTAALFALISAIGALDRFRRRI